MTKIIRSFFLVALFIVLTGFFAATPALGAQLEGLGVEGGEFCLSSNETGAKLRVELSDNGFVSGDFCIDGCGCGTLLGEAHLAEVDSTTYGTINLYADLPEQCAYGVWYSIDVPSLSHIWFYTGLTSTRYSGTGGFEEISCDTIH